MEKERFFIHCDMNNYFASVETLDNPYLKELPMVITGDIALHHGIVLSKNDIAKRYNIVTGESVYNAMKKCNNLITIKADYQKYLKYTKASRNIYYQYTDKIYPYGLDEAWLDVSDKYNTYDEVIRIGEEIKLKVFLELGLSISVGVSFNYVFSKLGSDIKSESVYVIRKDNFIEVTENMPAFNMLFVGSKTRSALKKMNILTIGDLRKADVRLLKSKFGKKGQVLYDFSYGNDEWFNPVTQEDKDIKSLGNTITIINSVTDNKDVESYIYILVSVLVTRMKKHVLQGKSCQLSIKYVDFSVITKQRSSQTYISSQKSIFELAYSIYSKILCDKPIRSITIRISNLGYCIGEQISLFDDNDLMDNEISQIINRLKNKYGDIFIEKSSTLKDMEG